MKIFDNELTTAIIINLTVITITAQCLIAWRRTEQFESFFPTSPYIKQNKATYKQAGLIGKLMRTGAISTVLALPSIFTKNNLVKREEIEKFPQRTKILLVSLWAMHITLFTALILSHYL